LEDALKLQHCLPAAAIRIVARGDTTDGEIAELVA
jgi:hypothetical protein